MTSIATLAGLLADPVRLSLVQALMDGRAWTAGELARSAGVGARIVQSVLLELELDGRIERHGSGTVSLISG